jgi:hypothetical protein
MFEIIIIIIIIIIITTIIIRNKDCILLTDVSQLYK